MVQFFTVRRERSGILQQIQYAQMYLRRKEIHNYIGLCNGLASENYGFHTLKQTTDSLVIFYGSRFLTQKYIPKDIYCNNTEKLIGSFDVYGLQHSLH